MVYRLGGPQPCNSDYRALLSSYYTTTTRWGILLRCRIEAFGLRGFEVQLSSLPLPPVPLLSSRKLPRSWPGLVMRVSGFGVLGLKVQGPGIRGLGFRVLGFGL